VGHGSAILKGFVGFDLERQHTVAGEVINNLQMHPKLQGIMEQFIF